MKNKLHFYTFRFIGIYILLFTCSFSIKAQSRLEVAQKFIQFVNAYQEDSLFNILDDKFLMTRTYSKQANDQVSFLQKYLPQSRALKARYKILKDTIIEDYVMFTVEDFSDYFTYLDIDNPIWTMSISVVNDKINMVSMDTTNGYSIYLKNIKQKDAAFNTWLTSNYPDETSNKLFAKEAILIERLKEYSKRK